MNRFDLISSLNNCLELPEIEQKDVDLWFPSQEIPFIDVSYSLESKEKEKLTPEERKKRNSESSARHRAKKKEKESLLRQELENSLREIDKLRNENVELSREVAYLRRLIVQMQKN